MNNVVLYPATAVGHLTPMMELARVFLELGYTVSVALIDDPLSTPVMNSAVERAVASHPSVSFHWLRAAATSLCFALAPAADEHFLVRYLNLVRHNNEHFRDLLCSALVPQPVHVVVIDTFLFHALDVRKELGVPAYGFFPSGAGALAIYLQLPSLQAKCKASFGELGDTPLDLLGVPPLPASHVPVDMLLHPAESKICEAMMDMCKKIPEFDAIMVNTFESLESRAAGALGDSAGLLPGRALPPVCCVGPLVKHGGVGGGEGAAKRHHHCLTWLDEQPDRSVVFLCFGSEGTHQQEQLREIAVGLEKSGHRFLWVVQAPGSTDPTKFLDRRADPDLAALLPEGFLERTSGRGVVVKLWAPQEDVLRHRATGAFVTHCGWNSALEGVTAGVPMICWPLYAEQSMNKVLMVEEMGVAVEMIGWQQGLVAAEEVEAKVRLVMESTAGGELRARVRERMRAAAMAWAVDGGPSRAASARLLSYVRGQPTASLGNRGS
uniref:Glycosyltransferase n=1 Tax=Oryza brachyantha TaxID=4533 RepID=J3M931_ORYBR